MATINHITDISILAITFNMGNTVKNKCILRDLRMGTYDIIALAYQEKPNGSLIEDDPIYNHVKNYTTSNINFTYREYRTHMGLRIGNPINSPTILLVLFYKSILFESIGIIEPTRCGIYKAKGSVYAVLKMIYNNVNNQLTNLYISFVAGHFPSDPDKVEDRRECIYKSYENLLNKLTKQAIEPDIIIFLGDINIRQTLISPNPDCKETIRNYTCYDKPIKRFNDTREVNILSNYNNFITHFSNTCGPIVDQMNETIPELDTNGYKLITE